MKANIYIKSAAAISPLQSLENTTLIENIESRTGNSALCKEPIYKNYIAPIKARRMSRIIKMTALSAKECLKRANIDSPEMISVATGMGCQIDTIKFLEQLIIDKEEYLKPTAFINSTHNTLAGYLAIDLKCKGQNFTFTHNELNFEHAILDAIIRLQNNEIANALIGAVDEISEQTHNIKKGMQLLCSDTQNQDDIFEDNNNGIIDGEAAVFLSLESINTTHTLAKISAINFAYNIDNPIDLDKKIVEIAKENNFEIDNIDAFLIGSAGNTTNDNNLEEWIKIHKYETKTMRYKHISGENMVSAGFGLWLSANIINQKIAPNYLFKNKNLLNSINNVLMINHNGNNNFSFILVETND